MSKQKKSTESVLEHFVHEEVHKFHDYYDWLNSAMSQEFFEEIQQEELLLIAHALISFELQGRFSTIVLHQSVIVLSSMHPGVDLKIIGQYQQRGIAALQLFTSCKQLIGTNFFLRIAILSFDGSNEVEHVQKRLSSTLMAHDADEARVVLQEKNQGLRLRFACKGISSEEFFWALFDLLNHRKVAVLHCSCCFDGLFVMEAVLQPEKWDAVHREQLKRDLESAPLFAVNDLFYEVFFKEDFISYQGMLFVRACFLFLYEVITHQDPYTYTYEHIREVFCQLPEFFAALFELFELKFSPHKRDDTRYESLKKSLLESVDKHVAAHGQLEDRRKTILQLSIVFVNALLKTNFYAAVREALTFRMDSVFFQELSEDIRKKFPEKPFALFFLCNKDFIGFHVRFQDLARGGLRTVFLPNKEIAYAELAQVFSECYFLALTQQKKNKDIPEGGAKGILFLMPPSKNSGSGNVLSYLYRAQRRFVRSLMSLIHITDKRIIDYYKRPELIYLGPDEHMNNEMINWIAQYSKEVGYQAGYAFISSKKELGINHKEYGVTSLGLNVCMEEVLRFMGIDPEKQSFTVKMSGGPDGDVAGNQIKNLAKHAKTCKLLSIIDISGVLYDPEGLNLALLVHLFDEGLPVRFYPQKKLHNGGFLLDKESKKSKSVHSVKTLCWKKCDNHVIEEWLSSKETQSIFERHTHQLKTDLFIPAGGRPQTLNRDTVLDFLDDEGRPTSRAIIEGANLYLSTDARSFLEEKGVIIIKDSSANKGGVIASSFEVLVGLIVQGSEFLENKQAIVQEILERIQIEARREVLLILSTYKESKIPCSIVSELISERIGEFCTQIGKYLENMSLSPDPAHPYNACIYEYVLPILRAKFFDRLLTHIPEVHKKAIMATFIATQAVYLRGLSWCPGIIDMIPFFCRDPLITVCPYSKT